MPKTRVQKENTVEKLTQKLTDAKSVVFADYKGLSMSQISEIRKALREQSSELTVTKNNLLKIALKNAHLEIDKLVTVGPLATVFNFGDEISPLKTLSKAIKDSQIGSIKGGILDHEFIDSKTVSKLASLPGKDELRAKIVGSLGAPLYGIVGVLQANLRNLVYALDQVRISKGGEAQA